MEKLLAMCTEPVCPFCPMAVVWPWVQHIMMAIEVLPAIFKFFNGYEANAWIQLGRLSCLPCVWYQCVPFVWLWVQYILMMAIEVLLAMFKSFNSRECLDPRTWTVKLLATCLAPVFPFCVAMGAPYNDDNGHTANHSCIFD